MLGCPGSRQWYTVMSGGQGWTKICKLCLSHTLHSWQLSRNLPVHSCILGYGQVNCGSQSMLILLDHSWTSVLIVVNAHSKWPEVIEMSQTSAARTIGVLWHLSTTLGIPEKIVSENGPKFSSADFADFAHFAKVKGIKYLWSSPYHPASNGEAERFIRMFKEAMKIGKEDRLMINHRLENFLLMYQTNLHATMGTPPCELLMEKSLHTQWDLLNPVENRD